MLKKKVGNGDLLQSSAEYSDDYHSKTTEWNVKQTKTKTNMEEVKQVITALKNKLMERHLMSKKIAELEKILQKINDATNEIIIEMNNRVDDLNRDWQERLRNENVKWENDIHTSNKYCDNKPIETRNLQDINNVMWRTERRLIELTDRLAPIQEMEQKLEEIIEVLKNAPCYHQSTSTATDNLHISESESVNTARTARNMQKESVAKAPNYYGVVEIAANYSVCLRNLERAIKSLELMKQMSALFGVSVDGISSVSDVNHTANVLKQFVNKLKISLQKRNLRSDNVSF
uniref:Uncharacterized protein n=1 Tax=Wuchereria bancrofti TaxID=6293 RepID=A0AAF5PNZ3_WUCBA